MSVVRPSRYISAVVEVDCKGWQILLAGPMRAGKSTLARGVAAQLDAGMASFGDAVRERTRQLGLPESRETLQSIGERWIDEDKDGLCVQVLRPVIDRPRVIVDGVRHASVANTLARLMCGCTTVLAYVRVDAAVRRSRFHAGGLDDALIESLSAHSTEADLGSLRELADIILDGSDLVDTNVRRLRVLVEERTGS